jgi:hypothetical protein
VVAGWLVARALSDQIRNASTLSRRASSDCAFYGFTPAADKISAAVPKLLEFHPGQAIDLIGHFRCKLIALLLTLENCFYNTPCYTCGGTDEAI